MNDYYKKSFDQIKISDKLDDVVQNTINNAIKDKKRKNIKKNVLQFSASVASLIILFALSINLFPQFAANASSIPIISSVSDAVQFHYDKNIANSKKQDMNLTKTDNNIRISIDKIVSDDKDLFILYTLNGEADKDRVKNLLLESFIITDSNNNIMIENKDSKNPYIPNKLKEIKGDYLSPFQGSTPYRCIVSALGTSTDNYAQNKKTYGSIEILSTKDSVSIPSEINLKISGLTEVYDKNYANRPLSLTNYSDFVSKYKREPIRLNGSWNFNIKIDDKLISQKSEVHNNIPFTANNTDFNIENFKIYPTHIEAKIQLGKNKIDNSQCTTLGMYGFGDLNKFPYLIDEKGTKYVLNGKALSAPNSENCINYTFESCYYNNPKELYLVISQLWYGTSYKNIEPFKVRIK